MEIKEIIASYLRPNISIQMQYLFDFANLFHKCKYTECYICLVNTTKNKYFRISLQYLNEENSELIKFLCAGDSCSRSRQ